MHQPLYFGDLMATACELSGSPLPKDLDSISFLPTLKGQTDKQAKHEFLYWEFYERTFRQAVIVENWKLIRSNMDNERIELYDLSQDIHEDENLAKKKPELAKKFVAMMEKATSHPNWPTPVRSKK